MAEPKMPSPEELKKIEASRREADIDLIRRGADYEIKSVGVDDGLAAELNKEHAKERVQTLGEWIRLNKMIVCPNEFLTEKDRKDFANIKRAFAIAYNSEVLYVDIDANVACFQLPRHGQVGEFGVGVADWAEHVRSVKGVMTTRLGFVWADSLLERFVNAGERYRVGLERQAKKKEAEEFNF